MDINLVSIGNQRKRTGKRREMSRWEFLFFLLFGFGSVFLAYRGYSDYNHMIAGDTPPVESELRPIEGKLNVYEGRRKNAQFSITENGTGKRIYGAHHKYSYAGIYNDHGKTVRILVARNKIFQIEVDGIVKRSYESIIQNAMRIKSRGRNCLVFGLIFNSLYGFYYFKIRR